MAKKGTTLVLDQADLQRRILLVRGHRVMLDLDLAKLYGVTTKRLNEQFQRNRDRFPEDFAFQLSAQEVEELRSQIATTNPTFNKSRSLPWVFTEHGVAMLSSVLRSKRAVQVNIAIVRAFVRMRRLVATPGELVTQLNELAKTVQFHDDQIKTIADVLRRMMEPPPAPPRRRIGFGPPESSRPEKNILGHKQNGAR